MISFIYQFRNKVNAMFGDDKDFMICEINEPLSDGTIVKRDDGRTLNILGSDIARLTLLRDYLGDTFEDGELLYIDYYFGRDLKVGKAFTNISDRPKANGRLDIKMLFEGNPHFSKFYSGMGEMGVWYCVAFKPELIQYYNEDAVSLHGRRSCAMEDIARELFPGVDNNKIYFSTENKEDFDKYTVTISPSYSFTSAKDSSWNLTGSA